MEIAADKLLSLPIQQQARKVKQVREDGDSETKLGGDWGHGWESEEELGREERSWVQPACDLCR